MLLDARLQATGNYECWLSGLFNSVCELTIHISIEAAA